MESFHIPPFSCATIRYIAKQTNQTAASSHHHYFITPYFACLVCMRRLQTSCIEILGPNSKESRIFKAWYDKCVRDLLMIMSPNGTVLELLRCLSIYLPTYIMTNLCVGIMGIRKHNSSCIISVFNLRLNYFYVPKSIILLKNQCR